MTGSIPATVADPPRLPLSVEATQSTQPMAAPGLGGSLPPARPMGVWRVRLVYGVLAFIVGGHLFEVVTQHENWPFSPYQMWSVASTSWTQKDYRVLGVTDEPAPREVSLENPAYLYPLPSRFVTQQLRKAVPEARQGKPAARDAIIGDYLKRYDDRRRAGLHHGPPLRGLRLYEYSWPMTRDAGNRDSPARDLLYETAGAKGVSTQSDAPKGREGGDVDPE